MSSKLTSRKFWMSVFGTVVGTVILFLGVAEDAEILSAIQMGFGALLDILVILGYLTAESRVDAARARNHK